MTDQPVRPEPPVKPRYPIPVFGAHRGGLRFGTPASEVPMTPWAAIPRWKKRLWVQCNHAASSVSAPRKEIGGVTAAKAVALDGNDMPLGLSRYDIDMPCPACGRVWRVPLASLNAAAKGRGGRPTRVLVQDLPGVSLAPPKTPTG